MSPKPSDAVRPHITEDLTEAQVAEAAFTDEVVVSWYEHGDQLYGIIVGYSDPDGDHTFASAPGVDLGEVGMFSIAPVARSSPDADWREIPRTTTELKRTDFVVFGPANRDPGDRELAQARKHSLENSDGPLTSKVQEQLINVGAWGDFAPFLAAATELMVAKQDSYDDLAFHVRLDSRVVNNQRKHRILVRPAEQPIMHAEIQECLRIADRYELACSVGQAGIEVHRPEDVA